MNLSECVDIPEHLNDKTFDPFLNIASVSLVLDKFEMLRSSCKYYSIPLVNSTPHLVNSQEVKLNILHVNTRSIRSNECFDEFQSFLLSSNCIWQVICVSETWLSDTMVENRELPGYTAYFHNRSHKTGGGVALYVNEKYIKNSFIHENSAIKCTQSLLIECQLSKMESCIIGLIYKPPDLDDRTFLEELSDWLDFVNNMNKTAFIAGDFNYDLFITDNGSPTLEFFNLFATYGFWPTIFKATRTSEQKTTLLDNIFCNNLDMVHNSGLILDDLSDHFPIFASCSFNLSNDLSCKFIKVFDQQRTSELSSYLHEQLNDFLSICDPIEASNTLINSYMLGIEKYSKYIKCTRKTRALKPWISSAILTSINTRNILFRAKLKNPSQENKEAYCKHRNCLNILIREAKKKYIQEQIAQSKSDSKRMWNLLNCTAKGKTRMPIVQKQFVDSHGGTIYGQNNIAESFNNYFVSVGKDLQKHIPLSEISPLDNVKYNATNMDSWDPTNSDELTGIIKSMKNVGAGLDNINAYIFKNTYQSIIKHLVHFANLCLLQGIFPTNLKCAVVKPIYKAGNKSHMNNYRPISILPYISKILEKIMHNRIMCFLNTNDILSNSQFGFQKGMATYMPLLLLQDYITKVFEEGRIAVAIYLDLKKAFDTVDPEILISKLQVYGFQGTALKLICSYLTERQQCVEYDGVKSDLMQVKMGVPQGSVLGPLLFLLYVNDLPNICKDAKFLLFADDTVVIFDNSDSAKLQKDLDEQLPIICEWFNANKLSLNAKKTVCQIYSKSYSEKKITVSLNNEKIHVVDKVKYLGVIIDADLNCICLPYLPYHRSFKCHY